MSNVFHILIDIVLYCVAAISKYSSDEHAQECRWFNATKVYGATASLIINPIAIEY